MANGFRTRVAAALLAALAVGTAAQADTYYFRLAGTAPGSGSASVGLSGSLSVRANAPVSASFSALGVSSPTWNIEGALPAGVTFSNGRLSGSTTRTGEFPFKVVATGGGTSGERSEVLTVRQGLSVTGPGEVRFRSGGPAVSVQFASAGALGAVQWSQPGGLPVGLTWDGASAKVSGSPTSGGDINVSAEDLSDGAKASGSAKVVMVPPVSVGNRSISGTANQALTASLSAANVLGSASWTSSSLPSGLSISSSGTISGTPSSGGNSSATVTVRDSYDNSTASGTVSFSFVTPNYRWMGTGEMVNTGRTKYPNCNGSQCSASSYGQRQLCEGYSSSGSSGTTYYSHWTVCQ